MLPPKIIFAQSNPHTEFSKEVDKRLKITFIFLFKYEIHGVDAIKALKQIHERIQHLKLEKALGSQGNYFMEICQQQAQ